MEAENKKETGSGKVLLALVAGIAAGVVIGYLLHSDKKEELVNDLKEGASKLAGNFAEEIEKGKDLIIEELKNALDAS